MALVPFGFHGTTEDVVPYKSWGRSFAAVRFGSCRLFVTDSRGRLSLQIMEKIVRHRVIGSCRLFATA